MNDNTTIRFFLFKSSPTYCSVSAMGIYDVDLESGDLFSKQQKDFARGRYQAGKKKVLNLKTRRMETVQEVPGRKFEQPRSTGPQRTTTLRMTQAEIDSAVFAYGQGMTHAEISVKFGRSIATIKRVLAKAEAKAKEIGINWREVTKAKAVSAVQDALDCKEDLYKRGGLGIQALKGLGEFESGGDLSLTAILNSVPPDMRDRYMELGDDPKVIPAKVKEIPDAVPTEKR